MQTRRFGRTEHMSTILIFGSFAVGQLAQDDGDGDAHAANTGPPSHDLRVERDSVQRFHVFTPVVNSPIVA